MAAHVLGWVGQITADNIADTKRFKDYGPNDLVGQAGLEKQYERFLQGHKGRQKYLINSNQEIVRLLGEEPAVPGDDLVLSLDIDAQRIAEQALADGIEHTRTHLRRLAGPARLPQGELRRGHRDGSDDRRDQGDGVVADVRSLVVRAGPVEEARRDGLRRQLGGALAQPRDAAVVRAGIDVQAVHRAGGRAARPGELQQLLPVSAGVRVSGRHDDGLPQLDHREPRHDLGRTGAQDLVRHGLLPVRRGLLRPLQRRPPGQGRDAAAGQPAPVRVRRGHEARPAARDDRV